MMEGITNRKMELIWYERVPYYFNYDNDIYETTMQSLQMVDPRVIVFLGDSSLTLFCWLHRYKIYGPNRVIFVVNYADSNANTIQVPSYVSEWCSSEMIRQVMNHTFVYGEANRADLSKNVPDSVGMTWAKFNKEIHQRAEDIENVVWLFEAGKFLFYDLMLFTGFMLDEAERLLNLNNDSLINWSVGSKNFKQNGRFLSEIFKKAIFNVEVVGMRGNYAFLNSSKQLENSGSTPIIVGQVSTFIENFQNQIFFRNGLAMEKLSSNNLSIFFLIYKLAYCVD